MTNPNRKHFKVCGNRKTGRTLAVPIEAYLLADCPEFYTLSYMQDGTLVYQPVKS
jgi:hypothetical protein